ncbi:DUF6710 family protein [Aliarcobacter cryaerophilus]|uniref:DUF6710 family protein n=1 Tax=Aliarcobacter cryaerophilus TaxID=28198 RepID=UPI00112F560E|nr:DUF6710 family protein [Aliarcobacter cryaerophilus]
MFEYIDKRIKNLKINFIKNFIKVIYKHGFKLVYVKSNNLKEYNIKKILEELNFLHNNEIFNESSYYNIDKIMYYFNNDKEIFDKNNEKLFFESITNNFLTDNNEYNQILLSNFLKYYQMGNILETYLPDKIKQNELSDSKYFTYDLISDEDTSLKKIINPHIISYPWSIKRLSKEDGLDTYNSIKIKGFKQDFNNHKGRYYKDIHTLIITNGNHSNAIGFMLNSNITYNISDCIKAYSFNDNIFRAEFNFDKMILDGNEYYIKDYKKAILLKLFQQIKLKKNLAKI